VKRSVRPRAARLPASAGPRVRPALFWSFRYYDTFFACRAGIAPFSCRPPKRIRWIQLICCGALAQPRGYLFRRPKRYAVGERVPLGTPRQIIMRLDEPTVVDPTVLSRRIADPYVLYLGRIDPNKVRSADPVFRSL
jgi:hypothetical protein